MFWTSHEIKQISPQHDVICDFRTEDDLLYDNPSTAGLRIKANKLLMHFKIFNCLIHDGNLLMLRDVSSFINHSGSRHLTIFLST